MLRWAPLWPAYWLIWWCYVDDIICIWPHGLELFQSFLDGLNQLVPSINLTTEWEVNDGDSGVATLPFLDVLIHRSLTCVTFSIYMKSSLCHMYIHYLSNHPPVMYIYSHTLAAFTQLGYPIFFHKRCTFSS